MAGTTTSVKKSQELVTQVALLEQTVVRTDEKLNRISEILIEIHNKLDSTILNHSLKLAEHKAELAILKDDIEDNSKEIKRVESRGTKIIAFTGTLFTIIFGAIVSYFIPSKP
jgi:hypothetical protein